MESLLDEEVDESVENTCCLETDVMCFVISMKFS